MALNEGDVLAGKYRVEKLLGEGGMGAVYVATNTVLQRQVALKVMTGSFSQVPAAGERFHREAIAASRVTHPSIVQVFDAGQHEGAPWIAMELLDGESLGDRLERGPLTLDEIMTMARGSLSALAEVHEQGIVHRDLKPDNIFLANDRNGSFVPKVLDFGIAKDTSDNQLNKLTATGAVVGTAYYLSPEQAKGTPDIDARADVYAMGVVLFEGLSGHMPYEADTITQLIAKMFTEPPRLLAKVAPHVPSPIADVVTTCLQQNRDHRFTTARELLDALENAVGLAQGQMPAGPPVGLANTMQGAQNTGSLQGLAPIAAPSGVGATAMGHRAGQPASAPGLAAASQPGVASQPGIPMTGVGQPLSQPGVQAPRAMHQTAHLEPHQVPMPQTGAGSQPGYAQAAASQPGFPPAGHSHAGHPQTGASQAGYAQPVPPTEGGGGKGLIIALVVALFFVGAAGTGAVAWLMVSDDPVEAPLAVTAPEEPTALNAPPQQEPDVVQAPTPDGMENADAIVQALPPEPASDEPTPEVPPADSPTSTRRRRRPSREQAAPAEPPDAPVAPPVAAPERPTPPPRAEPARPVRRAPRRGLSPQQIAAPLNARRPYAQSRCFERRRRRVPNLGGIVTIGWVVRPDGRADNVEVIHNGTGDEWFGRCIRNVVRGTRFPQATNGLDTPARYPFRF